MVTEPAQDARARVAMHVFHQHPIEISINFQFITLSMYHGRRNREGGWGL